MVTSEYLYGMLPNKLLVSDEFGVWYAFYNNDLSVLSNATGELLSYTYDDKSQYREVRRFITEEYAVKEAKAYQHGED
jgi:hypothetical protein